MYKQSIWILIFIVLISCVSAANPLNTASNNGLILDSPIFNTYQQNVNTTIFVHVYNASNGVQMVAVSSCNLHLYKSISQNEIIEANMTLNGIDHSYTINSSYLNTTGYYSILIQCNTTGLGGSELLDFTITPSGYQATTSEMYWYIFSLFIIFVLFIASIIFITTIDDKDTYDITGTKLLRMNSGIILKLFMVMVAIFLFWIITFILWQISYNSLMLTFITGLLRLFYIWYTILMFPILFMLLTFIFVRFASQIKFNKKVKRGLI